MLFTQRTRLVNEERARDIAKVKKSLTSGVFERKKRETPFVVAAVAAAAAVVVAFFPPLTYVGTALEYLDRRINHGLKSGLNFTQNALFEISLSSKTDTVLFIVS